jgi:hypothetical protein
VLTERSVFVCVVYCVFVEYEISMLVFVVYDVSTVSRQQLSEFDSLISIPCMLPSAAQLSEAVLG